MITAVTITAVAAKIREKIFDSFILKAQAQKTVIIIGGPTAVGKTAVAIALAQHLETEIISADSRQCFREMAIGVARPTPAELDTVPHHFVASHSIHEKVTAATFEQYALARAERIFQHHDTAVMVGGTGLYLKAFCEGLDEMPDVPDSVRTEIRNAYQLHGITWLQNEVALLDPHFFAGAETQNPQRLMRALEVNIATGRSILSFRTGVKAYREFKIIKLALELPKEQLHQRINQRVDAMMAEGLLEEVRRLQPHQHLNALQTVGYRELFPVLDGTTTLPEATDAIKRNTRLYAKRQMTWFRKDSSFAWFSPSDLAGMINYIAHHLPS